MLACGSRVRGARCRQARSRPPAATSPCPIHYCRVLNCLPAAGRLELAEALLELGLDVLVPVATLVDLLDQRTVVVGEVRLHRGLEVADLVHRHVVDESSLDRIQR